MLLCDDGARLWREGAYEVTNVDVQAPSCSALCAIGSCRRPSMDQVQSTQAMCLWRGRQRNALTALPGEETLAAAEAAGGGRRQL